MKKNTYESFGQLIKWPQCVITGKKTSIEQAKEILSKTDSMFVCGYDGNDTKYNNEIYNIIGRPHNGDWKEEAEFIKRNGLLELNYLDNSQISSCYVYGTNGWCHPNGTIFFNKNIGKWPSWGEIHEDCKKIARRFPFLDMKVYLFNQEWSTDIDKSEYYDCPRKCVGGFSIKNGRCRLLKESEYLSPNDEKVITHLPIFCVNDENKRKEKIEIFGEEADLDILNKTNEIFFNIDEFKKYFEGCFV